MAALKELRQELESFQNTMTEYIGRGGRREGAGKPKGYRKKIRQNPEQ